MPPDAASPRVTMSASADSAGLLSVLGEIGAIGLVVSEMPGAAPPEPNAPGVIRVGVCRQGAPPTGGLDAFDILLCAGHTAPSPWVAVEAGRMDETLDGLRRTAAAQPTAAAVAAQVLRMSLDLTFDQALALESLAYSMLLSSSGFRAWRRATPIRLRVREAEPRVNLTEVEGALRIVLTRPGSRNAFDARMRDELAEALAFALVDPDRRAIELRGLGPSFSAGGDLDEFGTAADPGLAHLVRTARSPAGLLHRLGDRASAAVHGACIGAGVEVAAAAARATARTGAVFRLPEVSMGLIPGAGGTASIPRRIGRQRSCYMALSGHDIDLATALDWGLVDAVELG